MAFIFQADIYCDACGLAIRERLDASGEAPADPDDEYSYDSDDYPKCAGTDGGEADCPQHCGAGADCLNPTVIDGENYGEFLENPLTSDGVEYVKESTGAVAEFWKEFYGLDDDDDDEDGEGLELFPDGEGLDALKEQDKEQRAQFVASNIEARKRLLDGIGE